MLNHIVIMGRMTRDPELRHTGSGIAVASFTLAVDRDVKGQDGERETDFLGCVAWRQTGEFVSKYFRMGSMAVVSGRLEIRSWTDKQGNKRKSAEIVAANVYFGDSKRDREIAATGTGCTAPAQSAFPETEAALARYGATGFAQNDFAMLVDDDGQLPF